MLPGDVVGYPPAQQRGSTTVDRSKIALLGDDSIASSTERSAPALTASDHADRRAIGLLSVAHAAVDLNPSALAALLPIFYATFHLSFGATALITAVSQVTNSVCQLPFGYLADHVSLRFFIPLGCLCAGLGLALAGLAPTYPLLLVAISVCGLGVAMFHPEAARTANRVSGQKRATAMSIFSVGGNLGFACGPLAASVVAGFLAREGSLLFLIPVGIVATIVQLASRRRAPTASVRATTLAPSPPGEVKKGQLVLLTLVTIIRSSLQVGIMTFVPLYEVTVLHRSQAYASGLITAFLALGAAGTIFAGIAADRWGRQSTVLVSFLLSIPLLALFRYDHGPAGFVALALAGGFLLSTFAVTIVMGQELLPQRTGVAAGLTIGFGSGVGGALIGGLGHLADIAGLPAALDVLMVLPVLAVGCALGLSRRGRVDRAPRTESEQARALLR